MTHDIVRWTPLSHGGWEAECACGDRIIGASREHADRRVSWHFNSPGLRAALEGREEAQ